MEQKLRLQSKMINELINFANELDKRGLKKEADYLDALMKKLSADDWKWNILPFPQHEMHTKSREMPGAAEEEAKEEYMKDLRPAKEVAEMIVGGTPIIGEDADMSVDDLAEILSAEEHKATVSAILDYFKNMSE